LWHRDERLLDADERRCSCEVDHYRGVIERVDFSPDY